MRRQTAENPGDRLAAVFAWVGAMSLLLFGILKSTMGLRVTGEEEIRDKVRMETAVNEDYVEPAVEAIIAAAGTGQTGGGKIFLIALLDYVIRTGREKRQSHRLMTFEHSRVFTAIRPISCSD